ncbi:hypothetical protein Pmani_021199 [Petrolisthes manimaculis]|uniref:Uncharacterized protein n=2 Tax=Petrolisthes TaxID=84661 RepID=A0AAE1PGU3_9EUCA|nr:hypothetical protein Pcinc_010924 [Petrolisthes cinctipes]KAK4307017.1 hypothetical protein Pmani_021199 [Petrolisthes manimaculis]
MSMRQLRGKSSSIVSTQGAHRRQWVTLGAAIASVGQPRGSNNVSGSPEGRQQQRQWVTLAVTLPGVCAGH